MNVEEVEKITLEIEEDTSLKAKIKIMWNNLKK
jgi:hypothetical protein